jgi:hypothetical protein
MTLMTDTTRGVLPAFSRKPRTFLALAALAFAGPVLATTARASVSQTQSLTVPLNDTNWSAGHMQSGSNPLEFTKFDPSLGTLRAVNVSLDYTFKHDISMKYDTPATIKVGVTDKSIALDRPDNSVIASATPVDTIVSKTLDKGSFPTTVTLPTKNQNGTTGTVSLTSAADLKLFMGSSAHDAILLPVTASALSSNSVTSGNGTAISKVKAGATVHLCYTYDPVPEPSTVAVFALSGLAFLYARRQRAGR